VGDRDIEVDAVALGTGRVHLLKPDRRALAERVDQGVLGTGAAGLVHVGQHGLPERPDGGDVKCVNGDLHDLGRP
jgi:hypothetical protein